MGVLSAYLKRKRAATSGKYIQGTVLELGCGDAATIQQYASEITRYVGIDHNRELVEQLRVNYPQHQFYAMDLDSDTLPPNGKFDTILALAVIEHIYNQKHFMQQLVQNLKPGGRIILTTPTPLGNDVVYTLGARLGLFDITGGLNDHIVIYNKKRFYLMARDMNLEVEVYRTFQLGCNQLVVLKHLTNSR